jgi:predicted TPR repeat methyltransferase
MDHTTAHDLEQLRRVQAGPLQYESAPFELVEGALQACGPGPFASALELGGSIGVFTELLAPRCNRLTRVDVAATAAAMARRRLTGLPGVEVVRGAIPEAIPEREYDLVVASEILYYLAADDFERTLALIRARLVSGGRLVAMHWRPDESERPFTAGEVHERLRDDPWLESVAAVQGPGYLLDALDRR